mmetsp:Transcript_13714/g.40113  ORF Transcript_13714/g.40113 Transcript_13714/m.40113 type:complete len:236 (-) Transcript_13714:167-874(-)
MTAFRNTKDDDDDDDDDVDGELVVPFPTASERAALRSRRATEPVVDRGAIANLLRRLSSRRQEKGGDASAEAPASSPEYRGAEETARFPGCSSAAAIKNSSAASGPPPPILRKYRKYSPSVHKTMTLMSSTGEGDITQQTTKAMPPQARRRSSTCTAATACSYESSSACSLDAHQLPRVRIITAGAGFGHKSVSFAEDDINDACYGGSKGNSDWDESGSSLNLEGLTLDSGARCA